MLRDRKRALLVGQHARSPARPAAARRHRRAGRHVVQWWTRRSWPLRMRWSARSNTSATTAKSARSSRGPAKVAVAKVKVAVEPVSLAAAGHAYDAGGASWVRESAHLQRFWLNMRTLYSTTRLSTRRGVIGDVIVNDGALPPTFF